MQLFSKTEKGSSETSSGPQNKSDYSYFSKKSQKKVRAGPNLAQSLIFMKLAKMAILGRKLKNQKKIFFSKFVLIQDYFMLSLSKFAQTNPCAAFWAVR